MFTYHGQKEIRVDHTHLLRTQGSGHQLLDGFRCPFSRQVSPYYRNTCKGFMRACSACCRVFRLLYQSFVFFLFKVFLEQLLCGSHCQVSLDIVMEESQWCHHQEEYGIPLSRPDSILELSPFRFSTSFPATTSGPAQT